MVHRIIKKFRKMIIFKVMGKVTVNCKDKRLTRTKLHYVTLLSRTCLELTNWYSGKVVSNIFLKNWLRRNLIKFNFLTKIIKISNICYFWRIFRNTYQNVNWPVNIFVIISWSKVKYSFLRLRLGVSHFCWDQVQT